MDPDKEEKEIERLFEGYRSKRPPEALMKNYAGEVEKKLERASHPSFLPWAGAAAFLFALALAGTLFVVFQPTRPKPTKALPAPAVDSREILQNLSDELLLLEMLGEDGGLTNEFDRVTSDMARIEQGPTTPFQG